MPTSLKLALMPDGTPEIFKSIQGEGPKIGRISTFVRTSECNLTCIWCDTPYTWRWKQELPHEDETVYIRNKWQSEVQLSDIVKQIQNFGCRHIIFTGGEPLLQQNRILEVIHALGDFAQSIEFETNGTIAPGEELIALATLFVVSPKLENSGVTQKKAIKDAITVFKESRKAAFKFVIQGPDDLVEISEFQKRFDIASEYIWVMPCGRSSEQLHKTGMLLAEPIIEAGYQFTPRMHVDLFGDAQGT